MAFLVTKDGRKVENVVQKQLRNEQYNRYSIAIAQAMYEIYKIDPEKCLKTFCDEKKILQKAVIDDSSETISINKSTYRFVKNSEKSDKLGKRVCYMNSKGEAYYCIAEIIEENKPHIGILASIPSPKKCPKEITIDTPYELKFSDGTSTGISIVLVNDDDKKTEKKGSTKKAVSPKQSTKKQKSKREKWTPSEKAIAYNDKDNQTYRINENRRYHLDDTLGDVIDDSYLECEKPIIDYYNQNIKYDTNRIYPCAFFELGLQGSIENALFLICNLNSGFTDANAVKPQGAPDDIDAFEDEGIRKIILKIRDAKKKDKTPEPHIALLKEVRKLEKGAQYPFVKWFRKICKGKDNQWLIDVVREMLGKDKTDDEIYDWLAYHFASRELVFYHTNQAGNIIADWKRACKEILDNDLSPHQKMVIKDLEEAIKLRIPIFMSRSQETWMDYVKGLEGYDLLFSGASSGGVYLSSNNLLLYQDKIDGKTSDEAKEKAWKKFTEAINKRYKELSSK